MIYWSAGRGRRGLASLVTVGGWLLGVMAGPALAAPAMPGSERSPQAPETRGPADSGPALGSASKRPATVSEPIEPAVRTAMADYVLARYQAEIVDISGRLGVFASAPSSTGSLEHRWREVNELSLDVVARRERLAKAERERSAKVAIARADALALGREIERGERELLAAEATYDERMAAARDARAALVARRDALAEARHRDQVWHEGAVAELVARRQGLATRHQSFTRAQAAHGQARASWQQAAEAFNQGSSTAANESERAAEHARLTAVRDALQAEGRELPHRAEALNADLAALAQDRERFVQERAARERVAQAEAEQVRGDRDRAEALTAAANRAWRVFEAAVQRHRARFGPLGQAADGSELTPAGRAFLDHLGSAFTIRTFPVGAAVEYWWNRHAPVPEGEDPAGPAAKAALEQHTQQLGVARAELLDEAAERRQQRIRWLARMQVELHALGRESEGRPETESARRAALLARAELVGLEAAHWLGALADTADGVQGAPDGSTGTGASLDRGLEHWRSVWPKMAHLGLPAHWASGSFLAERWLDVQPVRARRPELPPGFAVPLSPVVVERLARSQVLNRSAWLSRAVDILFHVIFERAAWSQGAGTQAAGQGWVAIDGRAVSFASPPRTYPSNPRPETSKPSSSRG